MQMTSIRPPAFEHVSQHGDLLTQLGAAKVEAPDAFTIKATYFNNEAAVNADALLKDTIWGAQLIVDNQSRTMDMPVVTAAGIADLLSGVAGLDVSVATERRPNGNSIITARTADEGFSRLVADLVEPNPTDRIQVKVEYANDLEQ